MTDIQVRAESNIRNELRDYTIHAITWKSNHVAIVSQPNEAMIVATDDEGSVQKVEWFCHSQWQLEEFIRIYD